jgi:hypothetical protein
VRARAWGASALALLFVANGAFAQTDAPSAAAERARFKAAQQLFESQDYAGALPIFRDVVSLGGSPNARLYAARCLRELGRLGEAYEEMTLVIRDADARAATESRYVATRDAAAVERAALASKVGLLVLAIADRPSGLVVKVAGQAIDEKRLGEAIALSPGNVLVEASAPGRQAFQKEVTLRAGASEAVAIALPAAVDKPPPPPLPPPPQVGGTLRTAGYAVAGLGLVGWVTFAVAAPMADDKYRTVLKACGGTRCTDPSYAGQISAGKTLDTVASLGLVTGLVGAAAGAAMIVFGGPRAGTVSAGVAPQGAWLAYRNSF